MGAFGLGDTVDEIIPYGCIMAGPATGIGMRPGARSV
jgi:hypothetical protein